MSTGTYNKLEVILPSTMVNKLYEIAQRKAINKSANCLYFS